MGSFKNPIDFASTGCIFIMEEEPSDAVKFVPQTQERTGWAEEYIIGFRKVPEASRTGKSLNHNILAEKNKHTYCSKISLIQRHNRDSMWTTFQGNMVYWNLPLLGTLLTGMQYAPMVWLL